MSTTVQQVEGGAATASADAGIQRYRHAERDMWSHYGLEPTERFIDLDSPSVRLRVTEVGSGEPIVFVHGTAGASPVWAPLARELRDFRCLMLDRPGWALSSPVDYSKHEYRNVVGDLLSAALDALSVDRAHVIGGSIGNLWALRWAQGHPSRVGKVVLMGGGPLVAEIRVPPVIKMVASPIGALMVRLPERPGRVRSILKGNGEGASLDAGRMDEFVTWRVALGRETDSMRHERDMVRSIVSWRRGAFRPGLTFRDEELAAIDQPTLMVYGRDDPVGSVDIWRRFVGRLPSGELHLVDGTGHLPWFDDGGGVARRVGDFLRGTAQ